MDKELEFLMALLFPLWEETYKLHFIRVLHEATQEIDFSKVDEEDFESDTLTHLHRQRLLRMDEKYYMGMFAHVSTDDSMKIDEVINVVEESLGENWSGVCRMLELIKSIHTYG